ncbi:MAG: hypothetical protein AAGG46_04595, partial [Planctomycetota bacterium]
GPMGFGLIDDRCERLLVMRDGVPQLDRKLCREAADQIADLFGKIPRLNAVAEIVRRFPDSTGEICHLHPKSRSAINDVGASLLHVAVQTQVAMTQGVLPQEIAGEVRLALPAGLPSVVDAIAELEHVDCQGGVATPLGDARVGMVLQQDFVHDGRVLVRAGRRLDEKKLANLLDAAGSGYSTAAVTVTQRSYEGFCPAQAACV